jgi:Flp pilus assembly protein TadD
MASQAESFDQAVRYHQSGQLSLAEKICRQILQADPRHAHAWHLLGLIAGQVGRSELAVEYISQAIRSIPDYAEAHFNLGIVQAGRGKLEEAQACYRQTLRFKPDFADAHNNLANVLRDQGKLEEAEASYRQTLRLRPDFAEGHYNLGNLLRDLGKLQEAEACFGKTIRLRADFAPAHINLGILLRDQGKLKQAEACLREAVSLKPDSAEACKNLGDVLHDQGKTKEAEACCREALRLQPGFTEAHITLAMVLRDQGKLEEAEACLREAVGLKPRSAKLHTNLGVLLVQLGRLEEAEQCLREALRHDPRFAGAWVQLANLLGSRLPDADLEAMRRLVADPEQTPDNRADLGFGLAQILDARQEYEEAGQKLALANALALSAWSKRGLDYDPAAHTQFVDRLMTAFSPAFFERVRGLGADSDRPIFIVGLPRSGTTLIEQVLARHSRVFGAGELTLARDNFLRLSGNGESDRHALDNLDRLDGPTIHDMADWHLSKLRTIHDGDRHIVDKMNDNYLYLGFLATLFPRAKFIHCRRDMRDIAVSCWMTNFRNQRWANSIEQIAARCNDYERLANHWRRVLPMPVLEVNYEETVADLECAARRLVSWCGLEWEPACLKFYESARPVRTASAIQVRQPIYHHAVARWKHYEKPLGPLFAKLHVAP